MDYLFFDIECADGHRICSFGYVLTDADFCIKEKRDILINPQCPFRLGRYKGAQEIELAYAKDEFYSSPNFGESYDGIAALFNAPDRLFFGHSVSSDITYLVDACMRYNKKRLKFDAYDTQMMYAKIDAEHRIRSLDGIMSELGIDTGALTEHKSCDDAEMTMYTAKAICERLGLSIDALAAQNADCIVNHKSIELTHMKSAVKKTVKSCNKSVEKESVKRQTVYISDTVIAKDAELRRELVRIAYRRGYAFSVAVTDADIIVTNGALTDLEREYLENNAAVKKLTVEKLAQLLRAKINGRGEAIVPLKRYFALHKSATEKRKKGKIENQ